ncbi:membrane-bound lytic murein transglycosylase MltF [Methylocaldum sp.]|uniref:membrane-bound lytic murein transglycosylase MltF n=1 Tax=Methylocaldum sp. TaxID=1969727 RepID=UPI0039C8E628
MGERQQKSALEKSNFFRFFIYLFFAASFSGCVQETSQPLTQLERIKQSGELRVVTRYGPSTYYESINGAVGLEHDLAELFAKRLNVKVKFIVSDSAKQAIQAIDEGGADIAAAGLIIDEARKKKLRFAPPYRVLAEQVLYSDSRPRPNGLTDLAGGVLEVSAGTSHVTTLKALKRDYRDLNWRINFDQDVHELLFLVSEGLVDYTVANSDQALIMRRYYPRLQVAFDIGKTRELAWALPMSEDASLYDETVRFFREIKENKTLDQLIDRYYGHAEAFDIALDSSLRHDYRTRLPKFKRLFVQAGRRYDIDWRLLAAIAYQESKWSSTAVSPEGVRGMMMLTGVTAKELKVTDRFNPAQSIWGGASYLRQTLGNIPPQIEDPDRTWYALAAYNLGYGHIEDARNLVVKRGGDPDKWIEIKKVLPLLGKPNWYRRTKYGRARGALAVHYVNSIRRYYDLLVWLTEENETGRMAMGPGKPRAAGV